MSRIDRITAGGKQISELATPCGLDHRHYAELSHTPGTGVPVVNVRCERQRGVLTTITGHISGQLQVDSEVVTGRPVLPEHDPIAAVLELHTREQDFCAEDGFSWPCRTVRAANPSEATRGRLVGRLEALDALWAGRIVDQEARADDHGATGSLDATRLYASAQALRDALLELRKAMTE